jgi:hypothetical protein
MAVPQLVNAGEVREEALLPSSLYLPGAMDFPEGSLALPWNPQPGCAVGRLAQKRGVENAGRLISSAKSWLSQAGVDRTSAILPWSATEGVTKLSPVEASRRYLEHLREAWDYKMPDAPFADQQALVTVPASFDAVARELTLSAAEQAGYRNVILLEEPQSAFYAWIERHRDWRDRVHAGPRPGADPRRARLQPGRAGSDEHVAAETAAAHRLHGVVEVAARGADLEQLADRDLDRLAALQANGVCRDGCASRAAGQKFGVEQEMGDEDRLRR